MALAYSDVQAAFTAFIARSNGRPFIVAGHSQGTVHGVKLLREIEKGPHASRLVAAYLPGGLQQSMTEGLNTSLCADPTQTSCYVAWSSYDASYAAEEQELIDPYICVNPISWQIDGSAEKAQHLGMVPESSQVIFQVIGEDQVPYVDMPPLSPAVSAYTSARLDGKHVVITGATAGIGQASAIALAKSGAKITIIARNQQKAENTLAELKAVSGCDNHRFVLADFGNLASVRSAAEEILSWSEKIDVLLNNAGVASSAYRETEDGYEELFAVNHLAGFLLTGLLMRLLLNKGTRIVNVSAMIYASVKGMNFDDLPTTKNFDPLKGYAYSKLANVLFTKELAERLKPQGVTCNVWHPGAVGTTLGAEDKGWVLTIASFLIKYLPFMFKTAEQGAAT